MGNSNSQPIIPTPPSDLDSALVRRNELEVAICNGEVDLTPTALLALSILKLDAAYEEITQDFADSPESPPHRAYISAVIDSASAAANEAYAMEIEANENSPLIPAVITQMFLANIAYYHYTLAKISPEPSNIYDFEPAVDGLRDALDFYNRTPEHLIQESIWTSAFPKLYAEILVWYAENRWKAQSERDYEGLGVFRDSVKHAHDIYGSSTLDPDDIHMNFASYYLHLSEFFMAAIYGQGDSAGIALDAAESVVPNSNQKVEIEILRKHWGIN